MFIHVSVTYNVYIYVYIGMYICIIFALAIRKNEIVSILFKYITGFLI